MFLEAASAAIELLEDPAITARWDEPSALAGYTVGGLAAHLGRAVSTPLGYLDAGAAQRPANTDAADYILESLGGHDPVDSDLHRAIRQRSGDMAASGPLAVLDANRAARQSLTGRLEVEPADRVLVVFGGTTARRVVVEVTAKRVGDRRFVLGLSRAERAQRPLAF